jgi:hypothetical protein
LDVAGAIAFREPPSGWLLRTDISVPAAPDPPVSSVTFTAVVIGTSLWSWDVSLAGAPSTSPAAPSCP